MQVKLSSLFLRRISSHVCDINISPLHVVTFFSDPHLVLRAWREIVEEKDPFIFHLNSSFPSFDWSDLNKEFLIVDIGKTLLSTVLAYDLHIVTAIRRYSE